MYGTNSLGSAGVGTTTLAAAGMDAFWVVVSGVAFGMAAVVLTRFRPVREF